LKKKLVIGLVCLLVTGLQGQGHGRAAAHQGSAVVRGRVEDDDLPGLSFHSQPQDHD